VIDIGSSHKTLEIVMKTQRNQIAYVQ